MILLFKCANTRNNIVKFTLIFGNKFYNLVISYCKFF